MPAVVIMPCLIWIILVIVIDSIIIAVATKRKLDPARIIAMMIIVSFFIGVVAPHCLIWIVLATAVMITISVWMKIREKPRRGRKLPKIKKW
jgi:hypothetical protein